MRTLNVMGYVRELNVVGYMRTLTVMGYMRTVIDNDNGRNYTSEPLVIEGAVLLAYIMGKLSYQNTCQQKILQKLPNSNLAQSVRKSRGMTTVSDRSVLWRLLSPHLLPPVKTVFLWSLKSGFQARSRGGRWSWAAKVGLLSLRVVPQQQCNGHSLCDSAQDGS